MSCHKAGRYCEAYQVQSLRRSDFFKALVHPCLIPSALFMRSRRNYIHNLSRREMTKVRDLARLTLSTFPFDSLHQSPWRPRNNHVTSLLYLSYPHVNIRRPSAGVGISLSKLPNRRIERVCHVVRIDVLGLASKDALVHRPCYPGAVDVLHGPTHAPSRGE
jgi:hypothetical protein